MKYSIRRLLALLAIATTLLSLLALSGCSLDEIKEEMQLKTALSALEDGDYDDLLDCLKENRDLAKNSDMVSAIRKHIRSLSSDYEDGDLDADDVEEILDELEPILKKVDSDSLWEKANELRETIAKGNSDAGGSIVPTIAPQPVETTPAEVPEAAEPSNGMVVALITGGGDLLDNGYNEACLHALENWCEPKGIPFFVYSPAAFSTEDLYTSVLYAIADGCNTIVLNSYLFGSILPELQHTYPDVYFIALDISQWDLTEDYVSYDSPAYNTACVTFAEEQAGFLAGYAAVMDGYTNLGFLGAMAVPAIVRYGYGFLQGADMAAAELGILINVNYTYCDQYYGSPEIEEVMAEWYASGIEVIFACGGSLFTSVVDAANIFGCRVIGTDTDHAYYSSLFLTSATKNLELAAATLLDAAFYGYWYEYGGSETTFSLADGAYVGLPTDSWSFRYFTLAEYQQLTNRIASGQYTVSSHTGDFPYLYATELNFY